MDFAKNWASDSADESSATSPSSTRASAADRPYVVGIGASAGGLESLKRFFKSMPADSGLAFVVIQHLSPDFKSLMDELLARHTKMRIHRVENGMEVEADSIYLIPPKKKMIISGGRLLLTDKDPGQDLSLPIDHFFRSLAQDIDACSVAVILSGNGNDGSRGILDIHDAGGMVIAQSEESAKFDGMPKSARDTGIVDHILAPEVMPAVLINHVAKSRLHDKCSNAPMAHDISLQKEAEDDRERYAEELESINSQLREEVARRQAAESEARDAVEKRDQFLAMLSHELRNPLAAVLSSASILQWDHLDKETVDEARGTIARQSRQMARLLDDLLDVSRIARGRIGVRRKLIDLAQTSREAVEAIQPALEGRHLKLHVDLPDEPLPVKGDAARLQQIQVNLLTNAIKYTPPGGEIWLHAEHEESQAVLRVRDTGVGIPLTMREQIFDLFVQVDDAPGKTEIGMGIGLTLVRTLVRLHGGEIEVQSDGIGAGSEFIVRLPLANEELAQEQPRNDREPNLAGLRVVLVEDRADIRVVTGRLLKAFGCEVTPAENGKKGIEAVAAGEPDVALIDIGLPDLSGYDVAQRIRKLPNGDNVKLLALTGFGQPDDREKALAAGFDDHLVKPLEYKTLLKAILTASSSELSGDLSG